MRGAPRPEIGRDKIDLFLGDRIYRFVHCGVVREHVLQPGSPRHVRLVRTRRRPLRFGKVEQICTKALLIHAIKHAVDGAARRRRAGGYHGAILALPRQAVLVLDADICRAAR